MQSSFVMHHMSSKQAQNYHALCSHACTTHATQAALTHRNVQRLNLWQHSGAPFKRNAHFMGSAEVSVKRGVHGKPDVMKYVWTCV